MRMPREKARNPSISPNRYFTAPSGRADLLDDAIGRDRVRIAGGQQAQGCRQDVLPGREAPLVRAPPPTSVPDIPASRRARRSRWPGAWDADNSLPVENSQYEGFQCGVVATIGGMAQAAVQQGARVQHLEQGRDP